MLRRAKQHADTKIIFHEIPLTELQFTAYSDTAWANRYDLSSQGGTFIVVHGQGCYEYKKTKVSVVEWSSRKFTRMAKSALSAELQSNSNCVDSFGFLLLTWDGIHNTQHGKTLKQRVQQAKRWAAGCVIDHKGLYDVYAGKNFQLSEKRSQVEAKATKESLEEWEIPIRWNSTGKVTTMSGTRRMEVPGGQRFCGRKKVT